MPHTGSMIALPMRHGDVEKELVVGADEVQGFSKDVVVVICLRQRRRQGPQHSLIDDHGVALTPEDGLFSGVVPYFAQGSPFQFVGQTSVYERVNGQWVRLSNESKEERIVVHDDTLRIVPVRAASECT